MTQHDIELTSRAILTPYTQWGDIHPEDAETEEGRAELEHIRASKYHQEEWSAGLG